MYQPGVDSLHLFSKELPLVRGDILPNTVRALSSALLLNTQDLAEETVTGVSLMTVGLGLSHTQAWENTSVAASFDYTHLGPTLSILPTNLEFDQPFTGKNGQLIFRHKTSPTGIFKAYVNTSQNKFKILYPSNADVQQDQPIALKNNHLFTQLSYREVLNDRWALFIGGGFTKNQDNIHSDFSLLEDEYAIQGKIRWSFHWSDHIVLKFGGEGLNSLWQETFTDETEQVFPTEVSESFGAGFVESDIYFNRKWVARFGIRGERSTLLNKWNIAPRASIAYQISSNSQFSFASGQFYQTPENTLFRFTQALDFEQANHFMLNYQHIKNNRTFRIEAYRKNYQNLVRFDPEQPWISDNSGHGHAQGIDVFYRIKNP